MGEGYVVHVNHKKHMVDSFVVRMNQKNTW